MSDASFTEFIAVDHAFPGFNTPEMKDRLQKWNLDQNMTVHKFRFTEPFKPGDGPALAASFAASAAVRSAIGLADAGAAGAGDGDALAVQELRTSVVHMGFFDRIEEAGLVAGTGYIRQMAEEAIDGVAVNDAVRDALVNRDSEHFELFSAEDRDEFIFLVFLFCAVGGAMCQQEDSWQPYLDATRKLYRELVSVHRATASGEVEVSSTVLRLRGQGICDEESPFSFAYLIVDPKVKHATIWRWKRKPFW